MEKHVALSPSEITQFAEESQTRLVYSYSRFLRNLLKYFKGTRILHL